MVMARILENFLGTLHLFYQFGEEVVMDDETNHGDGFQNTFAFVKAETVSLLNHQKNSNLQHTLKVFYFNIKVDTILYYGNSRSDINFIFFIVKVDVFGINLISI